MVSPSLQAAWNWQISVMTNRYMDTLYSNCRRLAYVMVTGILLYQYTVLSAPASAEAHAQVPAFTARYTLTKGNMTIGTRQLKFSRDLPGEYEFISTTKTTGIAAIFNNDKIHESSLGAYDGGIIVPRQYHYQHTGKKKDRQVKIKFDWDVLKATNIIGSKPWSMPVVKGTQDKLVYLISMMQDLMDNHRQFQYRVADGGKLKTYRFKILGKEKVTTPIGEFSAIKIKRIRKDNKRSTLIWCADQLHYLPIKIEQRKKDGTPYTMLLEQLSGLGINTRP
ncbi:MAG: hypothetical protein BMS9Abin26_0994 [Gammaproteobacteria bacterium]|nr:MAG: hypothetical protein BMS9Abin26_0994 [Gammaproteobacteria bacterium]